jgi:hypothetical protein
MEFSHFGSMLALIGMIMLLAANLNRRTARRRKVWTKTDVAVQQWGTLAAYALIAVGLMLLLGRK